MRRLRWPLRRLLLAAFFALAVLAVAPVATFNALETRSLLLALTEARLARRAALTAAHIDEHLRGLERWAHEFERRSGTQRLLAARTPDNPGRGAWEEESLGFVQAAEGLVGIAVVRADGARLAETGRVDVPDDLGAWPPFRRALAGEVVVEPRDIGGRDAQYVVLVPLRAPDGAPVVMALADDFGQLAALIHEDVDLLGESAGASLVDAYGIRLVYVGAGPDLTAAPVEPLPPGQWDALQARGRLDPGVAPRPVEDADPSREGVTVALETAPWTYALGVTRARFAAPVRRQLVRVLVASLAALVAAFALASLVARQLSQPFEALERLMDAWRRGERDARARPGTTRESQRLSEAFNAMAGEIEAFERSLQQKVDERTAQLEDANRELTMFTYSVSHDLRAPLRTIDGFTAILLEDEADALSPEGREMLERTAATVARMGRLIEALLALGRISRHELARERVDVTALAREIAEQLGQRAPERRVEWRVADGLVAFADATLLRAVLENLLGNAFKYTRDREVAHIEVGATADRPPAFFVRDDGAGFDMSHADQLFRPFGRLHPASDFPGTGVGLATVQRIVERHGGRVWATAAPGRGATFYFTFPG